MNSIWQKFVSGVLALSALAVAMSVVYTTFAGPSDEISDRHVYIDSWSTALEFGSVLGGADSAPVKLIVLMDFQCPACRFHHPSFERLIASRPNDVQVVYVHMPLSYHEHALPAARAAECAVALGMFSEWAATLYAQQDSIGLKEWSALAADAGIEDTAYVSACAESDEAWPRLEASRLFAENAGATGTPTVLINGWRYVALPSEVRLETDIDHLLAGGVL